MRSSHTDTASQLSVSRVTTDAHGNEVPAVHGAFQAAFLARKNKLAEGRREKHDAEQRKELAEHEFKVARLREEEERRLELERAKDEMKSAKDSLNQGDVSGDMFRSRDSRGSPDTAACRRRRGVGRETLLALARGNISGIGAMRGALLPWSKG